MVSRPRAPYDFPTLMDNTTPVSERCGSEIDFAQNSPVVARALIGATILLNQVGGVIVETEAYDQSEPASHGYTACTPRTRSLFGPPGRVHASHGT
jgi:3-methyladenine DNA glycosylase Mpg